MLERGGRNVISKVIGECKQVLDLSVVINNGMGNPILYTHVHRLFLPLVCMCVIERGGGRSLFLEMCVRVRMSEG